MSWKRIAPLIVLCAGLSAGSAFADETVQFESAPVKPSPFHERRAREQGIALPPPHGTPLIGYLSRPPGDGPFPAVVVMHGCGGLGARLRADWAERLNSWGYATLVVDSFKTRNIKDTCASYLPDRVYDAYGALDFLSQQSFIDPQRVALMGFSAGGIATLEATKVDGDEQLMDRKFKAAIGYYPVCSIGEGDATVPTLIMNGDRDDWSPANRCRQRVAHMTGKGAPVELEIYPGAYHDFDVAAYKDGRSYFGHWLQYDAGAAESSIKAVQAFLQKYVED